MRQFIFATHGYFAEGIKSSIELIIGPQNNIHCICAYTDPNSDLKKLFEETLLKLNYNDEIIVLTDIFGGSVNNEILSLVKGNKVHVISGFNLLLAIQLLIDNSDIDTKELINESIRISKDGVIYCNETYKNVNDEDF